MQSKEDILQQDEDNFKGLGCLGPPVHFKLNEEVPPINMPVKRVPVIERLKEKLTLQCYVEQGILKKN